MKIYDDEIMRLAKSRAGAGSLPGGSSACLQNPLCGDECTLYLQLANNDITAAAHQTRGCLLCNAAAEQLIQLSRQTPQLSAMVQLAQAFAAALKNGEQLPPALELFAPVMARKSRHRCVLLPYQALLQIAGAPETAAE